MGLYTRRLPEIAPNIGLRDQVTAVLVVLLTIAEKVCIWDLVKVTLAGVTVTPTGGFRVRAAVADTTGLAMLVAAMVTVKELAIRVWRRVKTACRDATNYGVDRPRHSSV